MPEPAELAQFVQLVTTAQRSLYAYVLTLVADPNATDDILQETNRVIWEKADQFEPGTHFFAWASKIAYFQTLAYLKTRSRERLRFDDELLARLADEVSRRHDVLEERSAALRGCLNKLRAADRDLIRRRYEDGGSIAHVADTVGRTPQAIKQALYRIRGALLSCVDQALSVE